MQIRFYFFLPLLLFLITPLSFASGTEFLIEIYEKGKVISYYDEYYVVQINGTANFTNNYNSTLYNIQIPYNIHTLNIFEESETDFIKDNQLEFSMFSPLESKSIDYEIRGITARDPMKDNKSILRSAINIRDSSLQPLLISRIQKADIEQHEINTSDVRGMKDRRLVSVILENPTDATYNISSVEVIKTPDQTLTDDNILDKWVYPKEKPYIILEPHSNWLEDIMDYNASPNEVYWLNTEMDTQLGLSINGTHDIRRFNQEDLISPENITEKEIEELQNVTEYMEHMIFARKTYSKTHVNPGDIVDVQISLNNFAPINRNITITDFIPAGFEILSKNISAKDHPTNLTWERRVNPDSIARINYQLRYVEENLLGVDYFRPALIQYEGKTIHTERIPFVRKYIPEKKIFVQKYVRTSLNDEYVVEITVQNVGKADINNLYVKEFLGPEDVFREITKVPEEKGLWIIPTLEGESEWKVSYVTDENDALYSLPEVFGVENEAVLKTLILENLIREQWVIGDIAWIEKLGIVVLMGGVVFFILFARYRRRKKEWVFRKFQKQIDRLKKETSPSSSDAIEYLKGVSAVKTKYPKDIETQKEKATKKPVSENSIKKEARENLEHLQELHEQLEKKEEKSK